MLIEPIVRYAISLLVPVCALFVILLFLVLRRKLSRHASRRLDDKILTVQDVAELCGVSPRTVRQWFRGGLPVARIGSTQLVRRKDLDGFVDNHITVR